MHARLVWADGLAFTIGICTIAELIGYPPTVVKSLIVLLAGVSLSASAHAVDVSGSPYIVPGQPMTRFHSIAGTDDIRLPIVLRPIGRAVRFEVETYYALDSSVRSSMMTNTIPVYLTLPAPSECETVIVRARGIDSRGQWTPWERDALRVGPDGPCERAEPVTSVPPPPHVEEIAPSQAGQVVASLGGASCALGAFLLIIGPELRKRRRRW
jgi:hypothetical protein